MKNLLVFIIFSVGIFQASDSNAQSMTSYFNANFQGTKVRLATSWSAEIFSTSSLESVFVKSRICTTIDCVTEWKRKVETCPITPPPSGTLIVACSALAVYISPTEGCPYCGVSDWRETINGEDFEYDDWACGVHSGGGQPE
ncbi:MAG TPA: hypothetical protein PKH39_13990 [Woeseiaceae bacterium]|nr:hypothetical protein [Woeseiaceae bacterium]